MIQSASHSRRALDAALNRMLGVPASGYDHTHVNSVGTIDERLLGSAILAALDGGHSYVLVHIPARWDVGGQLMADCVTATGRGVRVQRGLRLWTPAGPGRGLLIADEGPYSVGKDGLAPARMPPGVDASRDGGGMRAKATLLEAVAQRVEPLD